MNRKRSCAERFLACGMAFAVLFAGCGDKADSVEDYIGVQAAKEAALKEAGSQADNVVFSSVELESEDDVFYYEVVFTENGMEHEYEVDALTGAVTGERHRPADTGGSVSLNGGNAAPDSTGQSGGDSDAAQGEEALENIRQGTERQTDEGQDTGDGGDAQGIRSEEALSIALEHAGLNTGDVHSSEVKPDMEDGVRVFDVEFWSASGTEYDYELNAADGSIRSFEIDAEASYHHGAAQGAGMISEEQALAYILALVPGAEAEDITVYLDTHDDGARYVGRLLYDNMSHEIEISAADGELLEWDAQILQ